MSYRPPVSKFTTLTQGGYNVADTNNTVTLANKTLTSPVVTEVQQFGLKVSAKSADYTVLDDDGISVIHMTTSTTDRTVTLPTAADNTGRVLTIAKIDSGSGSLTIDGEGSETINAETTKVLYRRHHSVTICCDGTGWQIIDQYTPSLWQRNDLTSDITTTTADIADLRFENLKVGKIYRVFVHGQVKQNAVGFAHTGITIKHNGSSISVSRSAFETTTNTGRVTLYNEVVFAAESTEVNIDWNEISGNLSLEGSLSNSVYAILEELNDQRPESTAF